MSSPQLSVKHSSSNISSDSPADKVPRPRVSLARNQTTNEVSHSNPCCHYTEKAYTSTDTTSNVNIGVTLKHGKDTRSVAPVQVPRALMTPTHMTCPALSSYSLSSS